MNFEDNGQIYLEGPPEEVKKAQETFTELSEKLQREMSNEVIHVNPQYHRHIIGKAGGNSKKRFPEGGGGKSVTRVWGGGTLS